MRRVDEGLLFVLVDLRVVVRYEDASYAAKDNWINEWDVILQIYYQTCFCMNSLEEPLQNCD